MGAFAGIESPHIPNWEGFVANILRKGTPDRAYFIELFHDTEIRDAIVDRFDLLAGLDEGDPWFDPKSRIRLQRFCGLDYIVAGLDGMDWKLFGTKTADTADLTRSGGRNYQDEHTGPITTWEELEQYEWPDPDHPEATRSIEWYNRNLPDDMCIIAGLTGHFAELLAWLMGYETLCFALYDDPDLVQAIYEKVRAFHTRELERLLQFDRVEIVWGSDDMGFKTGTLISPDATRTYVLKGHKKLAEMAHEAGYPYLLHSCGNLSGIMDDLIDDVRIDGKHSYEDVIEDVRELKHTYGQRIALLGGIDVDFLCRADETAIRKRVRETLDVCLPGGGYCLGTGNSVTNYIPLDSYLAMVDEGMRYTT